MDTSTESLQVSAKELRRRFRTMEEKRRIVEETLAAGVSVTDVARAHGVHRNQVSAWRRLYRQALLVGGPSETARLLPVRVVEAARPKGTQTQRIPSGMMHLEVPKGHLRLTGCVDTEALRVMLEQLLG
jgi:transposase